MFFSFCATKCFFFATIRHVQAAGSVGFGVVYPCRGQLATTGLGHLGSTAPREAVRSIQKALQRPWGAFDNGEVMLVARLSMCYNAFTA